MSKPIPTGCLIISKATFNKSDNSLSDFSSSWLLPRSEASTIQCLYGAIRDRAGYPIPIAGAPPLIWSDVSIRASSSGEKPHLARVYSRSWEELMRLEAFDCIYVVSGGVGGYSIFVSKGHWGEKGEDTGGGHGVGRFAQGFEIQREYWEVGGGVGGGGGSRRSRWE